MKYSKNWLYIDLLNLITFLPFLLVLPLSVKIFFILGIYLIYKKNRVFIWVLGIIAIFLAFNSVYELKIFSNYVLFLVSLLLLGIFLQRTKEINFYIKFSPFLFFGLSIVYFQNIYMLFYLFLEMYLFLILIYYNYFNLKTAWKKALILYLYALPLVVLLFLFFPRPYQKHYFFGFSSQIYTSGFSETPDAKINKISLNSIPVVEFKLDKSYGKLYLRGEVLNVYENGIWLPGKTVPDKINRISVIKKYFLKQYPNGKKNIFAIDLPINTEYGYENSNFIIKTEKKIDKIIFFKITSALKYKLQPVIYPKIDLLYNKNKNLKTQFLIKKIKKIKNDLVKLNEIIKLFKREKIVYSLTTQVSGDNIVDSLFRVKKGYCIHFASAFAVLCRMSGIPSRLISGFVANDSINGYYKVYSKDAHVWVEVLINGYWKRIDPTEFAYKNETVKEFNKIKSDKLEIYSSYLRFIIEEWVIKYDSKKQKKFFRFFKHNMLLSILIFMGMVFFIRIIIKKITEKKDILESLYKKLGNRPEKESVESFFRKYNDGRLEEINNLYQKITYYKHSKKDKKKLKKLIKNYKKKN